MLAKGLACRNNEVTFLTNQIGIFKFPYEVEERWNVKILSFPDCLPRKIMKLGFGFISLLLKILYVSNKKFDIVHSDGGHRPSAGFPCRWHRFLHHSLYISEWWDYYGRGGQYENKHWLFKLFLGWYENKSEINNHIIADGVVVLSEEMRTRARLLNINENKITIIHGGADVYNIKYLNPSKFSSSRKSKIIFGYIGMSDYELVDLEPFIKAFVKCSKNLNIAFQSFGKKISAENKIKYGLSNIIESGWINYFSNTEILNNIDVFILIKNDTKINRAGWPNKLGDYMAAGRPVLLTPYGDLNNFSNLYSKGFIFADWNEKHIEERICQICDGKFNLELMGQFNRKAAEKELSWDHQSAILNDFYMTILYNKKSIN
jgi:glycosyltransferase involved in cell wall biosynthesis